MLTPLMYSPEQRRRFQEIFGVPIKPFWDALTGFDIVKFDDEVVKSGDESMSDEVLKRYGQDGIDLIKVCNTHGKETHHASR